MSESKTISELVEQQVISSIDQAVQQMVQNAIEVLALDPKWIQKIETMVNQNMATRLADAISAIDLNSLISQHIDTNMLHWQERLLSKFRANGIVDQADSVELTVMNGTVVVEHDLVCHTLEAVSDVDVKGSLSVNNLAVRGAVNVDNSSWDLLVERTKTQCLESLTELWQKQLVQQVLDLSRGKGIDFQSVLIQGQPLVIGNELGPVVTHSHLRSVGMLDTLSVKGATDVFGTLYVGNHRVGINTASPELALTVWDEEVCVLAGKLKQNHAFVGTARNHCLSLGVNLTPNIVIDTDGLVTVQKLRLDRWQISHAPTVPGWSGTRGDLVLNHDPKPDSPFAWVCLGAYQWQALRSA